MSNLWSFSVAAMKAAAKNRRAGYLEAIKAAAKKTTDTRVFLTHEDFARIKKDYALSEPVTSADLSRADAPSFLEKLKNFAAASAKHLAAGAPMASDAEIIRRHDICLACEFFKDNACQKCGCPVVRARRYVSKLSWADSECPVGKWGKESA